MILLRDQIGSHFDKILFSLLRFFNPSFLLFVHLLYFVKYVQRWQFFHATAGVGMFTKQESQVLKMLEYFLVPASEALACLFPPLCSCQQCRLSGFPGKALVRVGKDPTVPV